ncbi:MAG: hypothetical protein AVDCRST_MAG33-1262 [uncultured Thermomicrobiales bacterium]|uniref:Uncharacterized protein n=1 Tax=uncultured Thermomicrobiales bacterium TaxID=1645740 RepID=A0A6J4UN38_9BACT|nr:MAG: hypothetical protein AVDCRST_MAG33-1262 [uncultured Thermomicrobiales bacterium]
MLGASSTGVAGAAPSPDDPDPGESTGRSNRLTWGPEWKCATPDAVPGGRRRAGGRGQRAATGVAAGVAAGVPVVPVSTVAGLGRPALGVPGRYA